MSSVPWIWPEQNGILAESDVYSAETIRVFEVLNRWFLAMESGVAALWSPDPRYLRPNGKPPFTEQQVNDLINVALDEWFEQAQNVNYARHTRGIHFDGPPEFRRLAFPQRLALAQQLEMALDVVNSSQNS